MKEKERIRLECELVDQRHRKLLDEYLKHKKNNSDLLMEINFLQDQVNASSLNEYKLKMRQHDLKDELA